MSRGLKQHKQIHSRINPCNYCKKSFSSGSNLETHIRVHKDLSSELIAKNLSEIQENFENIKEPTLEPYECENCLKKFSLIGSLISHRGTHSNEKSVPCPLCDKFFKSKAYVRKHNISHIRDICTNSWLSHLI